MAKLVQKSGYIKSGKASGYMRYIATREGVEKLAGNGSVTEGQRELIQKLLTDFPDAVELFEYEDYCKTPTLGTASAFITMALDANLHGIDSESGYMQYIATRPRVQKYGSHGLFSSATAVDIASAMSELEAHEGNVWTIIYSLRREDAARLEYSAKCQFADDAEGVEDAVIKKDDLCRLRAALDQLSEEERALIHALFFDECSERELEEMMGIHRMTIHNRKIRILQKMKKMLR